MIYDVHTQADVFIWDATDNIDPVITAIQNGDMDLAGAFRLPHVLVCVDGTLVPLTAVDHLDPQHPDAS